MSVLDRFRLDGQTAADHRRQSRAGPRNGPGDRRGRGRRDPGGPRPAEPAGHGRRDSPTWPASLCRSKPTSASRRRARRRASRHCAIIGPIDILINNVGGRRFNIPTGAIAAGKVARDHRPESDQHLLVHQDHRRRDGGPRPRRTGHQRRVDLGADRQSRHRRADLRNVQGRRDSLHHGRRPPTGLRTR